MCAKCDGLLVNQSDVKKAMNMTRDASEWLNCEAIHKAMAKILEKAEDRGDYDGSEKRAIVILVNAGYQVERF